MDVCQDEDFQDDSVTNPSDQFDLGHGQDSRFPPNLSKRIIPSSSISQVDSNVREMLDPNDLQTCLFILKASETFIGDIGQISKS